MAYSRFLIMISRFYQVWWATAFFLWRALIHSVDFALLSVWVSPPSSQLIWITVDFSTFPFTFIFSFLFLISCFNIYDFSLSSGLVYH
ncbi:hypothetical protein BDP81DRAFT_430449 [Colletotrichum phormii]|uniref:Uncharacterized protein n=1 Tax=Colletotrichum phormii TaxID=359342 RepID=A0AAJ0EEB8_9PEZI|nr:uncharacterized protein BDP81DRAFT_430449 [Colletotrichum phormii]KAK1635859.1 hypothetical protein BDP81DRAFT_430449 [Colletotrichum phormii]